MASLFKRKNWMRLILALAWMLCCNCAVAEALFVALHDAADSHSHSDTKHDHHTNHHIGHSLPHEHEGMPNHESHGLSHSHNLILSSPVSVQPAKKLLLLSLSKLFEVGNVLGLGSSSCVSRFREDPLPKIFEYIGSSPTRAPPVQL